MTASLARSPARRSRPQRLQRLWRRLRGSGLPWRQHLAPCLTDLAAFCGALLCAGLAAVLMFALSGCGGGVGSEGTGSVASGSFASGTISGYGSIIVNGVHFDETQALVQGDDGQTLAASTLALGMVVQVTGGPISLAVDGSSRAVASAVRTQRALVGPVSARTLNLSAGTAQLTVLGQTVQIGADTVFDARMAGGLAAVTVGQWLEVYGFYDSTAARFAATRIAPSTASAGSRVSGSVMALDAQAQTFTLGTQTYSFAALGQPPAADARVTLKLVSPSVTLHTIAAGGLRISSSATIHRLTVESLSLTDRDTLSRYLFQEANPAFLDGLSGSCTSKIAEAATESARGGTVDFLRLRSEII